MNAHQERVLQSFRRVQGWFAANPQFTAPNGQASPPALATQLEALNGIVQRVTDHAAQQETQLAQSMLISKDEHDRRQELWTHHMASIVKVARALRGAVPGIGVLALPKGSIQNAALVTAATVLARKTETYKEVIVENGLPSDFIEQLEAATLALKGSMDARGLARAARSSATQGVGSELALGKRVVMIMDATLTRVLRSQSAKFAEWEHVKRVTLKGSSARGSVGVVEGSPSLVQSSPSAVQASPTEVVGSPSSVTRAA